MLTFFDGKRFLLYPPRPPVGKRGQGSIFSCGDDLLWWWGELYGASVVESCGEGLRRLDLKGEEGVLRLSPNAFRRVQAPVSGGGIPAVAAAFFVAVRQRRLENLLGRLDGAFAGVLWDASRQELHVFTDCQGLQPLYFWEEGRRCAWGIQLRDFRHLDLPLRSDALDCFLDLGHLAGEMSWFEGVRTLPAALYERRAFPEGKKEQRRYWHWPVPLPEGEAPAFEEAVEESNRLLRLAVRKRLQGEGKSAIFLSGGLDSRLVLAAALEEGFAPDALTMGMAQGEDLRLARLVSERAGVAFHPRVLDVENWLEGREQSTLLSDGLINSLHLHQAPFLPEWVEGYERLVGGLAMEVTIGGDWKGSIAENTEKLERQFGRQLELHYNLSSDFYQGRLISLLMDAYERHSSFISIHLMRQFVERPLIFADRDLLEYILRLPDSYRKHYRLYFALAGKYYAAFFEDIPWAKTGLSPFHPLTVWLLHLHWPGLRTVLYGARDSIADYRRWVRVEPARSEIAALLDPSRSKLAGMTGRDFLEEVALEPRFARTSRAEKLMRAVTAEWWLRYVSLPHASYP